jgi:DNA repair protein RadC
MNTWPTIPEVKLTLELRPLIDRPQCTTSIEADAQLRPWFAEEMETRERFLVLMLDRGNRATGIYTAGIGGLSGTVADPKLIFCAALKCLASAIVLGHNHPSGQLRPSEEDLRLTRKLVEAGKLLDICVHDHLILTREGFYSFADMGMLGR